VVELGYWKYISPYSAIEVTFPPTEGDITIGERAMWNVHVIERRTGYFIEMCTY
jgi:hypothetical protein